MLLRRLLITATTVAAGCGGPDPVPLQISMSLGTDVLHNCASDSCAAYGMGCGATIGIRIIDPDAEEGAAPLASDCIEYRPPEGSTPTLCNVDDVEPQIQLRDIPTGVAQVQIAIAAPPLDGEPPTCPDWMFQYDLNGIPRQEVTPVPAFGGATYVDVGANALVDVELACVQPAQINEAACLPQRRIVEVQLEDVTDALLFDGPVTTSLNVSVGEPRLDTTDPDNPIWVLGASEDDQVDLVEDARWEGERQKDPGEPTFEAFACVVVAPDTAPTRTVSCAQAPAPDPVDGHFVLGGLYLPDEGIPSREIVAQVLNAATSAGVISGSLPGTGMVVGRVVDHLNQPLGGVTVTPDSPGATVRYFTDDGSGVLVSLDAPAATVTNANGYFMSLDAPFGNPPTEWTAQHTDGRTDVGTYHAGLIANKMSLLLIRMEAP
jgi:hypothetical protein